MEEWYDEDENEPLFHDEYERVNFQGHQRFGG